MYDKMIDVDNLFNLFPEDDVESENSTNTYIDFKDSPIYWLGMYKKLILNHINFNKKVIKFFKDANSELDVEDMKEAGEFVTYNRAWTYVDKINCENPSHIEAIKHYSDEFLETSLELGIAYFQNSEEYEKCAKLLKIFNKSKLFSI
tara:strand:+ start:1085 stop:1525 length:441 start_codon:yes stop_codon:yes gene_type:complete